MKSLAKCLPNLKPEKITSFLLPNLQSLYEDSSAHFKSELATTLCNMAQFVGKEVTISKLVPILLELTKDEEADVRLNCANGFIQLAEIVGAELLTDSLITTLTTLTKDCQWRVREKIFNLVGDLGIKFGKDLFNTKLSSIMFAFLTDTAATVRTSVIPKVIELADSFKGEWAVLTIVPRLNEVFEQEKQGYLYRMSVLKTAIAIVPHMTKSQSSTHILPLLQKASKDDIPNVKITLAKLIPTITVTPEGNAFAAIFKP